MAFYWLDLNVSGSQDLVVIFTPGVGSSIINEMLFLIQLKGLKRRNFGID